MGDTKQPDDHILCRACADEMDFDQVALRQWEQGLEADLEGLVARWATWAAPRAARSNFSGFRR